MPDYCQSCLKDVIISTDSMPRLPRFRPISEEILVSLRGGWSEMVTVSGSASGAVPIIYETLCVNDRSYFRRENRPFPTIWRRHLSGTTQSESCHPWIGF